MNIQSVLRKHRNDLEAARKARLAEEMWQAHRNNNRSEMHGLRIEYQRNGMGSKEEVFFQAHTWWDTEEWLIELGKRPHDGGLAAVPLDLEEYEQEHGELIAE